jgi:hypothetical protein
MASKQITKAEAFYIEGHFGTKPPSEIAEDLGLSVKKVNAYIAKLDEAGVKPAPTPDKSGPRKAGFAVKEGETGPQSVSSTQAASAMGDELHTQIGRNEKFFEQRVKNGIHVMDPSKPVR